ncbi:D-alanine--D-alanine ligase A, partial [Enterococcus faecalis]|nr:D-alanine--D-alanine ligase A [Enterococcus faecalis]
MKIILLYGGRSEEHDVSVLSAYSVLNAIYYKYYQVQLVFISKDGQWVKGPLLSERPQNKEVLHLTWA